MKYWNRKRIITGFAILLSAALTMGTVGTAVARKEEKSSGQKYEKVSAAPQNSEEEALISKLLAILTGWYIDPKDEKYAGGFLSNLGSQDVPVIEESETETESETEEFGIDFEDVSSLEKALSKAEDAEDPEEALKDLEGSVMSLEPGKAEADKELGFVINAGDHLKLVSEDNRNLPADQEVALRIDSVKKEGEDWIISYTPVDPETGEEIEFSAPSETPTITPTKAPTNTPTPAPKPTAVPTATPVPTPIPAPTPTPVPAPKPVSITGSVNGTHYIGENLSAGDFVVKVTMSDGSVLTNPPGFGASPLLLSSSSNTITLTYQGISGQITVTAVQKPAPATPTPVPTTPPAPTATPIPLATVVPVATATPIPSPTPVPVNPNQFRSYAEEIFNLQNQVRAEAGVPALTWDESLYQLALTRALEGSQVYKAGGGDANYYYTHVHDGWSGRGAIGENCAFASGKVGSQQLVDMWKGSSQHYKNMINPGFTKSAVGIYMDSSNNYYFYSIEYR